MIARERERERLLEIKVGVIRDGALENINL